MSEKRLENKVCIITGSTAGIGQAIAELFAEHGGHVVVSGRRAEKGRQVVEQMTGRGHTAVFQQCDVAEDAQMDALVSTTVERFGGLDVLVNNAANVDHAAGTGKEVETLALDDWDLQLRINLRSVYYLSKQAIPLMRQRGGGTIVNVSSVGSMVGWPQAAAYLTAKGGMNQLTKSMAIDYMKDNIRVNALCPGWILSEIEKTRIAKNPSHVEEIKKQKGIARMGETREMAYAALFLACHESSYVTGTALVADGGWTLQ